MKLFLFVFFSISVISCRPDEFDAKRAAAEYCSCVIREKSAGMDFFNARMKCEGQQLMQNRFFRIDYMDMNFTYRNYSLLQPQRLRDSIAAFHQQFYGYIEENCCKEAVMGCDASDSVQAKMKAFGR